MKKIKNIEEQSCREVVHLDGHVGEVESHVVSHDGVRLVLVLVLVDVLVEVVELSGVAAAHQQGVVLLLLVGESFVVVIVVIET